VQSRRLRRSTQRHRLDAWGHISRYCCKSWMSCKGWEGSRALGKTGVVAS
jgi:hypothetical protein